MARQHFYTVILLAGTVTLSACGGGDGGVNSVTNTPPPAAPSTPPATQPTVSLTTISSPATRPGTYDMIAIVERDGGGSARPASNRLAAPGEIRISTYRPTSTPNELSYTLEFATADLPANRTTLTALFPPRAVDSPYGRFTLKFGDQLTVSAGQGSFGSSRLSESSESTSEDLNADLKFGSQLSYDAGLSHVSLGQWNWWVTDRRTGNNTESGSVHFVHGDRTPAAEIPASGTATYSAVSRGDVRIALTADFGQRSMAAQLNRDYSESGDSIGGFSVIHGVDLHGTGPIASPGSFSIPLSGTMVLGRTLVSLLDPVQVTGALDGAFFGPNVQQVGGVFAVGETPGVALLSDAFVGVRN